MISYGQTASFSPLASLALSVAFPWIISPPWVWHFFAVARHSFRLDHIITHPSPPSLALRATSFVPLDPTGSSIIRFPLYCIGDGEFGGFFSPFSPAAGGLLGRYVFVIYHYRFFFPPSPTTSIQHGVMDITCERGMPFPIFPFYRYTNLRVGGLVDGSGSCACLACLLA